MATSDRAMVGPKAAALALHRFGFGPAGGEIAAIASDPRGALLAALDRPAAAMPTVDLPSSAQAARAVFDFQAERRAQQKLALRTEKPAEIFGDMAANQAMPHQMMADVAPSPGAPGPKEPPLPQRLILNEARVRFDAATNADIGFVERLVWFWSNHFCISADKIPAMAGAYEREAIRPHVLGRFADLLQAVESHPAMLFYLDNVESMGPNSVAGLNRDKGLNENLARETLELHTLGVHAGYTQADVTNFAKVLTGWTWIPPSEPDYGGRFIFNRLLHEPGAQHLAQQLASHFVADVPPPALVDKLTRSFKDSDGDLKAVARTLINADESWIAQRQKLKTPAVWIASVLRATGAAAVVPIGQIMNAQATLGEPLWRPPAPNGFSDTEAALIDGVPRRLDIANAFAGRVTAAEPLALLESSIGPLASAQTRDTVAHAETRRQAVALLVMAPEFLRS